MSTVAYDEVVAEAMLTIGADGSDEIAQNFARQLIWRGLQRLGMSDNDIEVCRIDSKNLLLKKPKNLKKTIDLALFDSNDCYIPHRFHEGARRIYPQAYPQIIRVTCPDGDVRDICLPIDLSENRHSYVIGTNSYIPGTTNSVVSYAMVRYYAYPLDNNGLPIIQEFEVEPLTLYVRYKWSQRKNENQSEIQLNQQSWKEAADWCIAHKKSMDNTNESKKAQAIQFNRMIPNFNRSQF